MTARWWSGACALVLMPGLLSAQQAPKCVIRTASISAENQWLRMEPFPGSVTEFWGGRVRFDCQGQNVHFGGDSLQIINNEVYWLIGHAFYRDAHLSVSADTLSYTRSQELIRARLNVKVTDLKTSSVLSGPSVDFMRAAKGVRDSAEVSAIGRPTVRYLATAGSAGTPSRTPWTVSADHLRGFGQSRLWGGGAVAVVRDSLHITSDSVEFTSGGSRLARFIGVPARLRRVGSDSFTVTGKTLILTTQAEKLTGIRAFGEGDVTRSSGEIKGDSVVLDMADERLALTRAWGHDHLTTLHNDGYDVAGDSLAIETPGEVLRSIRIFGHGVIQNPWDSAKAVADSAGQKVHDRDTLWGDRITALFRSADSAGKSVARIEHLEAIGQARSFSYMMKLRQGVRCPTLAYLRSDTILITMKTGDSAGVAEVRHLGHMDGVIADRASLEHLPGDSTGTNPCRQGGA